MIPNLPRGLIAPILTQFNDDLSIACDLYAEHAHRLLDEGCVGLAPFGTTGESLSVGIDERIAAIRALIDAGIDPTCLVPGTGLSNIADSARLSRACLDLGCAAVMTLPPFFFKNVDDDGLFRYFDNLVSAVGGNARIVLYHIPPVAIVGISPPLARRLYEAFPQQVVAIKDSSGDWDNTRRLFAVDGLAVYPGSELPLIEALEAGGPGCISATANVNAPAIAEVIRRFDAGDRDGAARQQAAVRRTRVSIQAYAPIPAQKWLLARQSGDARWVNVRPPLTALADESGAALVETLESGRNL